MLGRNQKSKPPKSRTSNERQRQLVNLGLVPDLDNDMGSVSDGDDNDAELEAELQSLMFSGSKANKPQKRKSAASQPPVADLDAMVAACMADVTSDSEDFEDDPELLNELAGYASNDEGDESEQIHNDHDHGCAGQSLLAVIDDRIEMYVTAEKKAKEVGESSRARRFARGLATLSEQRRKIKNGKAINENDIPPAISNPNQSRTKASEQPPQPQPAISEPSPQLKPTEQPPTRPVLQPPPPKPVASRPTPPKPTNSHDSSVKRELTEKRSYYKALALEAKAKGDKQNAILGVKGVKQCDELLQRFQAGHDVDLSFLVVPQAPQPPTLQRAFSRDDPIDIPENPEDIPPPDPKLFGAPPPANTTEEALLQRLAKYRADEAKAKEENNSSRMRRLGRICKQYEEAIKLNKKGKLSTVLNDLPCPPGFGPVPFDAAASKVVTTTGPAATKATGPATTVPADAPVKAKKPMSLQEKNVAELLKRQDQFKKAALEAKKTGQIEEAKEYLKQYKGFEKMIEAAKSGLPVDFKTLPVAPQGVKDVAMDFEIVSTEDCTGGNGSTLSSSLDPAKRQEMYVKLEQDLLSQIKMCQATRLYFKSTGEVASMNKFQQMEEHTKKDLDSLRFAFKRGDPVPKFHYEVRAFSKVVVCPDLTDNELEFSVQQGINLNVAKDAHTYCRIEFPYPKETPFKEKSGIIKDSNSPQYNFSVKVPLNLKEKSCQRIFKRSTAKVEVWNKVGFLRSDVCVGSVGVKLQPLESRCVLHDTFPLMDGRRAVGGQLEIKIRLRNPVVTKQIEKVEEKWLLISFNL